MPNARDAVLRKYPNAEVVRGSFGLIVTTGVEKPHHLGDGRSYWDEEAWLDAVTEMEELPDLLAQGTRCA